MGTAAAGLQRNHQIYVLARFHDREITQINHESRVKLSLMLFPFGKSPAFLSSGSLHVASDPSA